MSTDLKLWMNHLILFHKLKINNGHSTSISLSQSVSQSVSYPTKTEAFDLYQAFSYNFREY